MNFCFEKKKSTDKNTIISGIVTAIVFLLSGVLLKNPIFGFVYAFLFWVALNYNLVSANEKQSYLFNCVGAVFLMFMTYVSTYFMVSAFPGDQNSVLNVVLNLFCVFIVCGFIYIITARFKLSVAIGCGLLLLLTLSNGFVYHFRGKELSFYDILSIKTAMNVASQYRFKMPGPMVHGLLIWFLSLTAFLGLPEFPKLSGCKTRLKAAVMEVIVLIVFVFSASTVSIQTWNKHGTRMNGYFLNFYIGIKDSKIKRPDKYNSELPFMSDYVDDGFVPAVADSAPEKKPVDKNKPSASKDNNKDVTNDTQVMQKPETENEIKKDYPNIIVIMSESYADPSVLGEKVQTNIPVTPFYDSLTENTIKGYALSSVFGANTANSEFEFLTGHSMFFMPDNSVPYQQFIHGPIHSLPWYLRSLGYRSVSTHPYYSSGWSREILYPLIGFEESTYIEEYKNSERIREYVSDKAVYTKIIDRMRSEESDAPMFVFGVTMQNHGGYVYDKSDFVKTVDLVGYEREYPLAEQYLTLIHESDKALEYFLSELSNYEEDTLVLFFGDHFPKLENEFYEELYGGEINTLEEQFMLYKVPFFVWANYDIEERTVDCSSLNFLSLYLLEEAGIELSPYFKFLSDFRNVVPAMNSLGYYSITEGRFLDKKSAVGIEEEWLNQYSILQYNNFDEKGRNNRVYGQYIDEETLIE